MYLKSTEFVSAHAATANLHTESRFFKACGERIESKLCAILAAQTDGIENTHTY